MKIKLIFLVYFAFPFSMQAQQKDVSSRERVGSLYDITVNSIFYNMVKKEKNIACRLQSMATKLPNDILEVLQKRAVPYERYSHAHKKLDKNPLLIALYNKWYYQSQADENERNYNIVFESLLSDEEQNMAKGLVQENEYLFDVQDIDGYNNKEAWDHVLDCIKNNYFFSAYDLIVRYPYWGGNQVRHCVAEMIKKQMPFFAMCTINRYEKNIHFGSDFLSAIIFSLIEKKLYKYAVNFTEKVYNNIEKKDFYKLIGKLINTSQCDQAIYFVERLAAKISGKALLEIAKIFIRNKKSCYALNLVDKFQVKLQAENFYSIGCYLVKSNQCEHMIDFMEKFHSKLGRSLYSVIMREMVTAEQWTYVAKIAEIYPVEASEMLYRIVTGLIEKREGERTLNFIDKVSDHIDEEGFYYIGRALVRAKHYNQTVNFMEKFHSKLGWSGCSVIISDLRKAKQGHYALHCLGKSCANVTPSECYVMIKDIMSAKRKAKQVHYALHCLGKSCANVTPLINFNNEVIELCNNLIDNNYDNVAAKFIGSFPSIVWSTQRPKVRAVYHRVKPHISFGTRLYMSVSFFPERCYELFVKYLLYP